MYECLCAYIHTNIPYIYTVHAFTGKTENCQNSVNVWMDVMALLLRSERLVVECSMILGADCVIIIGVKW